MNMVTVLFIYIYYICYIFNLVILVPGRMDIVKILLAAKADANTRDSFDRTPAHLACCRDSNGHVYSLMALVEEPHEPL